MKERVQCSKLMIDTLLVWIRLNYNFIHLSVVKFIFVWFRIRLSLNIKFNLKIIIDFKKTINLTYEIFKYVHK